MALPATKDAVTEDVKIWAIFSHFFDTGITDVFQHGKHFVLRCSIA
ncbi:hypothetical protein [Mesorhizobium amorphae]|nr:hypothetical protein [Mesorhizobium amorphae]